MSDEADLSDVENTTDSNLSDVWDVNSDDDHDEKCIGDLPNLFDVKEDSHSDTLLGNISKKAEEKINHEWVNSSESADFSSTFVTPKLSNGRKKYRSPASKSSQLRRLLRFQEKLVNEKGLPKSRLQSKMDVTPGPDKQWHEKPPKCSKNLLTNFQGLEASPCFSRSPAPSTACTSSTTPSPNSSMSLHIAQSPGRTPVTTSQMPANGTGSYGAHAPQAQRVDYSPSNSLKPAVGLSNQDRNVEHVASGNGLFQCQSENTVSWESEFEGVKNIGDYPKVISSGHENLFSLSHSRYETDQRDILPPRIPSTTTPQTQSQWGGEWQTSVYPPMSEAFMSGYSVGLGVAAQVYCWGCNSFGVIVPSTALAH